MHVFGFPSLLASIRMGKYPSRAHCNNLSALLSPPWHWAFHLPNAACLKPITLRISWWEGNVPVSSHTVNPWHWGTKGKEETQRPSSHCVHMAIKDVAMRAAPWLFAFPLPFPVILSPWAIFASLLSCHATVLSFLIPIKESALLWFPQEMGKT